MGRRQPLLAIKYGFCGGKGVVGGEGLPSPCPLPPRRAGDQNQLLGRSRRPATKKEENPRPPQAFRRRPDARHAPCAGWKKRARPKGRATGTKGTKHPAPRRNPAVPYDLQAGSESIGVDWSPLPCACERTTCLPVPIIQLRKRKRGLALPYAAQQRGNRRLPFNPHHRPHTGN